MHIIKTLRTLSQLDLITVLSCIYFCANLTKKNRLFFQKEYGMQVDNNLTNLIQRLKEM